MSTERTPLRLTEPGPNYVFVSNSSRVYRRKVHQFQCCICATVLSLFVMALIISVSYYVNHDPEDEGNSTLLPLNVSTDGTETPNLIQLVSWPIPEKPAPDWSGEYVDPSQLETAVGAGKAALMARDMLETRTPTLSLLSPSYRHQKTVRTNARADQLARAGYVMDVATRTLVNSSGKVLTGGSVGKGPAFDADWMSKEACADGPQPPFACNPTPYRTADGTCNNLNHPYKWGVALRPFRRVIQPDYADGVSAPRVSSDGSALPSARKVSVTVHRPLYQDDPDFTVMLAVWGQFMDHDITATALSQAVGGKSISCCKVFTSHSSVDEHPECFPVPLADGDPFYNQWNISCMEFVRSAPAPLCHFGPREQLNQASSYLDGSVVYGPYDSVVNKLRSFQGGQLRMYTTEDGRTLLPTSTDPTDGCNQQEEALKGRYCFESGDPRANENLHLTTMHLMLARQHNRVAQQLSQLNPVWSDERLFQESRRIVVAQMQHITYNEFLPIILGNHLMDSLELKPKTSGYFTGYNATVDVTVANHFATAAFRFAHTLLPGLAKMLGNDTSSTEYVEMHKMLFNPFRLYSPGQLDNTLRGALNTTMQKFNPHFSNEVTEHLFERPVAVKGPFPCGLDLVSLNIQRGRDHGLPSYPVWRELCGLTRPASFEDLQGVMNPDSIQHISQIYKSVDDVDMYTGMLSEFPVEGGVLGPTVSCLITDQFLRLKFGDRFWYETPQQPQAFTPGQLDEIRKTTLAGLICDTSDSVEQLQPYVMRSTKTDNTPVKCSSVPRPNLSLWKETDGEFVKTGSTRLKLGASVAVPQVIKAVPKTIRIGARVTGGSVTMNSGTWKPTFPVTIPVSPFDAIATSDEVPSVEAPTYGHSIVWRGTLSEISPSGDLTISATFSLPKYVHGTNLFFIEWLNGNIQFHLNTIWNATGKSLLPATGLFSSSVHFKDTWKYSYLKDVDPWLFEPSLSLKNDFSANPNVVLEPKTGCAVIILLGSYSSDRSLFLWSGELTLVLSPATEEIAMPTSSKLFVKQSNVNSLTDAIPSTTRVVAAVTGGSVSTSSGSWTSTFPVGIPVYPFNDVASSYIADALADTTLPVYGHGIIWQGTVSKPSSSDTLQVSGSFSLPRFMHGDPSTFSIQWLNGDFTFQLQPLYNITGLDTLPITDVFSSSVYFQERKEYAYLKNLPPPSSGSLPVSFASTPSVVGGPDVRHAPIIMLGTYSLDRSIFWWSGNASLYVKNKILPMTSQVSWSEKNKESVNAKLSNLNEGASSSDLQEIEPIPKTLTFSAKVMGGSFTTNSGTWKSNFPVTLPVISFDAISKTDEVPAVKPLTYGHGILWRGTLSEILPSGDLTLSATFSLPRYVHGPEIFDMEWLNGNIQLQLHTLSNVTGENLLPINGLFYSSVHFKETWQYSYLKDVDPLLFEPNLSLKNDFSVNPDIVYEPKTGQGVIILLGTYTSDHSSFIWSGDLTLVLSPATEEIAMPTSSNLFVKQSNVDSLTDAIPSTTRVVAAVTGGSVSTSSGSWTSTFPVGIPVYPFNDVASSYIADALADTTLPVYGHGIIWQGTVSKPSSSDTLQVSGSFSLPRFMHGDPSTFSIQWLNGDFTFQLQPLYNITGLDSLPITDVFSSSVYFQERKEYAYLKNLPPPSSGSLPVSFTSTPSVVGGPNVRHAPLVLLGAYSLDESVFWWSGKTSLYIRNKIPSFIKQDYSSNVKSIKKTKENNIGLPVLKDSVKNTEVAVSLKVKSGEMSAYLKNESEPEFKWDGNLPLNIPYPLFDKQLLTASDTLVTPVMGQGIIWSANLSNNFTSGDRLNGEFSFTRYVHGNISSTSAVEFWRGSFTFDIDLATNTSLEGLVNPDITFTSPVYFTSTPVVPITTTLFSSETAASTQAPIILEGNFSSDRSFFLWTGDAKLILPTMKLLESSAKSVTKVSVSAEVTSGNISVSGTNVWSGSLPVPIPVLKTKPLSSGTPIFGNKISWSGNLVTNSSEEVKFTGTFSSQNLTGGLPLSGDFSFDLSLLWNTTVNGLVKPSSVYSSIIILRDMKASQSTKQVLSSTPIMTVGVSDSLIPIILKGSYSPDNTIFYWSGNAIISFPK